MSDIEIEAFETKTNSIKKKVLGQAILIFFGIMLILTFFSNTINNFSLPVVQYEMPGGGMLVESINASGTVVAKQTQSIYTDTSRLVNEVKVRVGDSVRKGQVLVILDRADLEEQLQQRLLAYDQSQLYLSKINHITEVEKNLEKVSALYNIGGETLNNVEKAERDLADLKNDVKKAQDDIKLQELEISKVRRSLSSGSVLTAPFDGIITELNFSAGSKTNPGQPALSMAVTAGGFYFKVTIDIDSAKYLAVNDQASIYLGTTGGLNLQGEIAEIVDNPFQRGSKKDILVEIPSEGLSGGESGALTINKNIGYYNILVSNSAVGDDNTGKFVYVLKEKRGPLGNVYNVQQVKISIGESDNFKTAVLNGLQVTDKVITGSDKQLTDGSRVTVN